MARIKEDNWPVFDIGQLKKPNLFVVDMINGFVREGALADPAIAQAAGPIESLLNSTQAPAWFVCDSHTENAREFASYPVHCLAGSPESEVIDELKPYVDQDRLILKDTISAAAVEGFFERISRIEDGSDLIITGCCTDLCIAQLALPLQFWIAQNKKALRVIVPVDCVDTYDIESLHPAQQANQSALEYMSANGVTVVSTIAKKEEQA